MHPPAGVTVSGVIGKVLTGVEVTASRDAFFVAGCRTEFLAPAALVPSQVMPDDTFLPPYGALPALPAYLQNNINTSPIFPGVQ